VLRQRSRLHPEHGGRCPQEEGASLSLTTPHEPVPHCQDIIGDHIDSTSNWEAMAEKLAAQGIAVQPDQLRVAMKEP
jgi:hypothetical protein